MVQKLDSKHHETVIYMYPGSAKLCLPRPELVFHNERFFLLSTLQFAVLATFSTSA